MCFAASAFAQTSDTTLNAITVKGTRSVAEQNQLPNTTESVTAQQAEETINATSVEDTLKYMPSILIRKRYIGDSNAPMATRTTGINASARSLIYVDGISLSTLVNNNNGNGSPQWFMVAPEEIDRIDIMYGPFSAMYPGNSYGAVTEITTRTPKEFEASIKVNTSMQDFSQYGTSDNYPATQGSVYLGNRSDKLSWSLSVNHLDSYSQPLTYLTIPQSAASASIGNPAIAGANADLNRTGGAIQVLGAGNLMHTVQDTARIKLAYDFTPSVTAAYTLGYWQNNANASSQSYLTTGSGSPYFGAASGAVNIAGNAYNAKTIGGLFSSSTVDQQHWMQSLSLKAKDQGPWTWEAIATSFNYASDITRTSTGLYPDAQTSGVGRIADAGGTGWNTLDLKGNWHPKGPNSYHSISFGAHVDQYTLVNPTYNTGNWVSGDNESLYSDSRGKTRTSALWAQDAWELSPSVVATIGARYEWWRAFDGYNLSTGGGQSFGVRQPEVSQSGISPKLSLAWQANDQWSVTGSFGKALRFPTVGELYQNVQTGTTFTQANPFLSPERVLSGELAIERNTEKSKLRVSLFEEHVSNALIAQTSTITGVALPVSFVQNIDATRQRGIELSAQRKDVLIQGLELSGSITYVDARITANGSYVPTAPGATSVGKRTPYVPMWRAAVVATYRPDDRWAFTAAGRYSSRMYATIDNTDINPATYTGFESYLVLDARVAYKLDKHWNAAVGIDNLTNRQYFLYHPFPQRTIFAELKYNF